MNLKKLALSGLVIFVFLFYAYQQRSSSSASVAVLPAQNNQTDQNGVATFTSGFEKFVLNK